MSEEEKQEEDVPTEEKASKPAKVERRSLNKKILLQKVKMRRR